jgi:hypothetical protein
MDITSISLFALLDYFAFNLYGIKHEKPYRIIMVIIQIAIIYCLWYFTGFVNALCFTLLWWFGIADLLYYVYDWILSLIHTGFENGEFFKSKYENMKWLYFTPYGILGLTINKSMFIEQCIFGVAIVTIIKLSI